MGSPAGSGLCGSAYDVIFAIAYVEVPEKEKFVKPGIINKEPAKKLIGKYDTNKKFDDGLKKLNAFWTELLEGFEVLTRMKISLSVSFAERINGSIPSSPK